MTFSLHLFGREVLWISCGRRKDPMEVLSTSADTELAEPESRFGF